MQTSRPPKIKTPNGKIASLPLQIRCEVNKRIRAREHPAAIAHWLNSEYSVLEVLEGTSEDAPVTHHDIEEWRNGGFLEWMPAGDFSEQVHFISEYAADVRSVGLTTDDLFMTVLAHHAQFIRGMELVSDEVASRRMTMVERLTKSVLSLRRSELAEARKEIELGRLELARECKRAKFESLRSSPSSPALSSPENPAILGASRPSTTPALKSSDGANPAASVAPDHHSENHPSPPAEVSPLVPVHQVPRVHTIPDVDQAGPADEMDQADQTDQVNQVGPVDDRGFEVHTAGETSSATRAGALPPVTSPTPAPARASATKDAVSVPSEPAFKPPTRIASPSTGSSRNKFGLL